MTTLSLGSHFALQKDLLKRYMLIRNAFKPRSTKKRTQSRVEAGVAVLSFPGLFSHSSPCSAHPCFPHPWISCISFQFHIRCHQSQEASSPSSQFTNTVPGSEGSAAMKTDIAERLMERETLCTQQTLIELLLWVRHLF